MSRSPIFVSLLSLGLLLSVPLGCEETPAADGTTPMPPVTPPPSSPAIPASPATPPPINPTDEDTPGAEASRVVEPAEPVEVAAAPPRMTIGRQSVAFPPAVLHLLPAADHPGMTKAVLFSDDPEDAIKPDWAGDSFYFEMEFEGDPASVVQPAEDGTMPVWQVYVQDTARQSGPSGVFLDGGRVTLQPIDAEILIEPNGEHSLVQVVGLFRRFEGPDDEVGVPVNVSATVLPTIRMRD